MSNHRTFNIQGDRDGIKWARHSWNPFTGCRYGCPYCYGRDIAVRFLENGFEPTFYEERLEMPFYTKIPKAMLGDPCANLVFLGSMTDFFGDFIPAAWIETVLRVVQMTPEWTYLILTKNPDRIKEFVPLPANVWVGATIDTQARVEPTERAFRGIEATVKFISCEPLLERLTFSHLDIFKWVIVGGRSRNTKLPAFQPEWAWVESLLLQSRQAGCKVFFKPNLTVVPMEYPIRRI